MAAVVCPSRGPATTCKNGRDPQGRQIHQCRGCYRRFTALSGTPFSGYRFPPDVVALAVRWYIRYLSWPCAPCHPVADPPRSGQKFGGA